MKARFAASALNANPVVIGSSRGTRATVFEAGSTLKRPASVFWFAARKIPFLVQATSRGSSSKAEVIGVMVPPAAGMVAILPFL